MKTIRLLPILLLAGISIGANAQTVIVGNDMKIEGKTITYNDTNTKAKGDPLYVVRETSGAETQITKEIMEAIDPGRIKSIEVMKDARARQLYGRQAKYGVIIITLKETTSTAVETVVEGWGILSPEKAKPTPLIILRQSDGEEKEITQAEMEAIDPNNIKSLDIKNDRTTIENYGPKASDGVIIIRLKE